MLDRESSHENKLNEKKHNENFNLWVAKLTV